MCSTKKKLEGEERGKMLKMNLSSLHSNLKGINYIHLKNRGENFFPFPL
jgi:hypothetical protein